MIKRFRIIVLKQERDHTLTIGIVKLIAMLRGLHGINLRVVNCMVNDLLKHFRALVKVGSEGSSISSFFAYKLDTPPIPVTILLTRHRSSAAW